MKAPRVLPRVLRLPERVDLLPPGSPAAVLGAAIVGADNFVATFGDGAFWNAFGTTALYVAIAVGLDETDDVHLGAVWEAPEDTDFRKLVSAPEGSPEVFVGTEGGQDEVPPPEGARPVCVLDGPDGGRFVVFVVPPAR